MKIKLITIILLFNISAIYAQTYDEKIEYVRKHFFKIESAPDDYLVLFYSYDPYGGDTPYAFYDFVYNEKNELKNIHYHYGEEGYYSEENYYFADGKLIFVYTVDEEPDWVEGEYVTYVSEQRIYLYDNEIFEYFIKSNSENLDKDISEIKNEKAVWNKEDEYYVLTKSLEIIVKFAKLAE